jgi:hypothetical protein
LRTENASGAALDAQATANEPARAAFVLAAAFIGPTAGRAGTMILGLARTSTVVTKGGNSAKKLSVQSSGSRVNSPFDTAVRTKYY